MNKIQVYFVSDGTGLSTEQLGKSILIQFPDIVFEYKTIPFVNTLKKAQALAKKIKKDPSAMVFSTIIYGELNQPFDCGDFFHINFLKRTIDQSKINGDGCFSCSGNTNNNNVSFAIAFNVISIV